MIEYVDHLHEHFLDPVVMRDGRYMPPTRPATAPRCGAASLGEYRYPDGAAWVARKAVRPAHPCPPRAIEAYERLHAEPWPGVLAAMRANIRNYSIFRHGEDLFAYFEYTGDDFEADMAAMAADPVTQRGGSSPTRCRTATRSASRAPGG